MQIKEAGDATMAVAVAQFKETLAHWASGVTVITALAGNEPVGITASSFTSLSIDPPQILVSVSKRLYTHNVLRETGRFAVSILREDQAELGKRFAGMLPEISDRFAGLETMTAVTGCPILADALAWVDCEVSQVYDGSDHSIFIGAVIAAGAGNGGAPLIYYNRGWRKLAE